MYLELTPLYNDYHMYNNYILYHYFDLTSACQCWLVNIVGKYWILKLKIFYIWDFDRKLLTWTDTHLEMKVFFIETVMTDFHQALACSLTKYDAWIFLCCNRNPIRFQGWTSYSHPLDTPLFIWIEAYSRSGQVCTLHFSQRISPSSETGESLIYFSKLTG